MNDKTSRGYLIRLEKARFENEEKNNRIIWNPRGLIRQTSHYSRNLTDQNNLNSNNSLIKKDENKAIRSNSIIGSGSNETNNTSRYNLNDTKKNLKTELLNIQCLTINTESDEE